MRKPNAGFALPMVVFVIAVVTLLLTAAFAKVSADRRIGDASGANVNATAIAKAALQQYLGTRTIRPVDGDSLRVNVTGGYADVIAKVIRRPADTLANWMFVVRAVGRVIDPTQGADPQAVRTLAQFAQWQTGRMDTKAAYLAVDGLNHTSTAAPVTLTGIDSAGCGAATTYGMMMKNGSAPTLSSPATSNGTGSATQSNHATWAQNVVLDSTNLDWAGIVNGGFTPDYTSYQAGNMTYSSQFINGPVTINNMDGSGILIVKNDLTLTGGTASWKGVILVGGKIIFTVGTKPLTVWIGGTNIQGMVAAGLNQGGAKGDIGAYPLIIQYNSCRIRDALAKLTGFAPIANGWVDNWATY